MGKKGVSRISGPTHPTLGEKVTYKVAEWYPSTPLNERNSDKITWELFRKRNDGKYTTTNIKKKGIGNFTFTENAENFTYKIEGYLHRPEGKEPMAIIVHPQKSQIQKDKTKEILGIALTHQDGSKITKPLSYMDRLKAVAKCKNMVGEKIVFTLWEDDESGAGHNTKNQYIAKSKEIIVDSKGNARWEFALFNTYIKLANLREDDTKQHEYYVMIEYDKKPTASQNVNVNNPEYKNKPTQKPIPKPDSAKGSSNSNSKNNQPDKKGEVSSVKLLNSKKTPITKATFGDTIYVQIKGSNLDKKKYTLKIWEDDDFGKNDLLYTGEHIFSTNTYQEVKVTLTDEFRKIGELGNDPKNPDKGEYLTGNYQEIFAEVELLTQVTKSAIIEVSLKAKPTPPEQTIAAAVIGKLDKKKKESFEKVIGLGKEAVLYITSEIATEIVVDKNNKITSYPDYGGYNGMDEYNEGNKIYAKKLPNGKSAFPLYKTYIYRGSKIGEAIQKLKQDIDNKTHENAETTILTVARHAQNNNTNYGKEGPLPPNTINSLYRVRYMQAWNHSGKESFRYRFVDGNISNLKPLNDFTKEVSSGAMTLGSRSSISIDPWKSKDLIGCLGIRNSDGENHPSCSNQMSDLSSSNYKYVYHTLNNYLETIIPELTGVYGRRGYSSNGKVVVKSSEYKEEIKVFALVDPLPELNNCKLNLKKDGREAFYNEFGEGAIQMVDNHKKSNKFKGLYMVAQRRQENSFNLEVPNNNPMNIKGRGDLGSSPLKTHEYENGKKIYLTDGFANFSSVEKGFEGYLQLLQKNFSTAYDAIIDDSKTVDDFLIGMQDKGRIGAYATDPKYKTLIKDIFNGVVKDYKEILTYRLCKEKSEQGKNKIKKDIELLNKLK